VVITVLWLFVVFESQLIAVIRAGRVLMAELGLLKKNLTIGKFSRVKPAHSLLQNWVLSIGPTPHPASYPPTTHAGVIR
jgi:hypothetical protein